MNRSGNLVKGIVLAGGEGKRLRPLSYYFQKCMIPIRHSQKPLLEYIIRLLKHHGITDISLLVGYKNEQIANYFNCGNRFGVNLSYVLDNSALKGTGGSLLNAYRSKSFGSCEDIIIYYGDIISNINLTEMLKQHTRRKAVATLALSKGLQVGVGVAKVKRGNVTGWVEKPTLNIDVGIGVLVLNTSALRMLESLSERYEELDIMGHLIPHLIEKRKVVNAYLTNAFWYDVGSTDKYEKLDNTIIEKQLKYLLDSELESTTSIV